MRNPISPNLCLSPNPWGEVMRERESWLQATQTIPGASIPQASHCAYTRTRLRFIPHVRSKFAKGEPETDTFDSDTPSYRQGRIGIGTGRAAIFPGCFTITHTHIHTELETHTTRTLHLGDILHVLGGVVASGVVVLVAVRAVLDGHHHHTGLHVGRLDLIVPHQPVLSLRPCVATKQRCVEWALFERSEQRTLDAYVYYLKATWNRESLSLGCESLGIVVHK